MIRRLPLSALITSMVIGTLAAFLMPASVSAVVDDTPDCGDGVAIIDCGAFNRKDLREKAAQGDVPKIFKAFGISQKDLEGKFVEGIVWRDGRVTVDGKTVATGAMTAGRNFGGNPIAGTNAGKYPTSRFATEGQTAFVRMVDGRFDFAVIKACGNPVSATPAPKEEPPKPKYECVRLEVEKIDRTTRKFIATATAENGATIEKYQFGFGDGNGITVKESSYTYDYKKTGTFDTDVVVHVRVDGQIKKVSRPACEKTITVSPEKPEPCPYDSKLPKDSPDCQPPVEKCPIEGKTHLPKDSPDCKQDEPEVLPAAVSETGPGGLALGGLGLGTMTAAGYYWYGSKRRVLTSIFRTIR